MNRTELVSIVALTMQAHPNDVEQIVDCVTDLIQAAVASGDSVKLRGFGTFEPRRRAPRLVRNPRINVPLTVGARTMPSFRPARAFRDRVITEGAGVSDG